MKTAIDRLLAVAPEFQLRVDQWRRLGRAWSSIHGCLAHAMRARGIEERD